MYNGVPSSRHIKYKINGLFMLHVYMKERGGGRERKREKQQREKRGDGDRERERETFSDALEGRYL